MEIDPDLIEDEKEEIKVYEYLGSHPHIVKLVAHYSSSRQHITVMEYCPAGDLFDRLKANGKMQIDEAKMVYRQLLETLEWLHKRGLAHLDVSLENILLTVDSGTGAIKIKLTDFGMAQFQGSLKWSEWVVTGRPGKRRYMPPEIRARIDSPPPPHHVKRSRSRPTSSISIIIPWTHAPAADIWSSGVCFFQMLTGVPPWNEANVCDTRYNYVMRGSMGRMLREWGMPFEEDALDFFSKIFTAPEKRSTITELLAHKFLAPTHIPLSS